MAGGKGGSLRRGQQFAFPKAVARGRTRWLLIGGALVVGTGAAILAWLSRGPTAAQFAHLLEPRLTRLPNQRVLVVEATGDPNRVGAQAFGSLFRAYYKLDGVSRLARPPAPRARWRDPAGTPKHQWLGQYALPVSDAVTAAPTADPGALRATIATWAYGDVAEVLHVGSYSTEQPDIERLHAFIASQGYQVVGDHEEEYVKGPGMLFTGDPETYLTIIRLRVEKRTGVLH